MPDVLGSPPSPRAALFWNGATWQAALVGPGGRLQVRGEDQLYSVEAGLVTARTAAISGAGGFIDSNNPGAGTLWKVTSVGVQNQTSPFTRVEMMIRRGATDYHFHSETFAWGAGAFASVQCEKWLATTDIIRVWLAGALAGDTIKISLTGHVMTLET